MSEGLIAIFLFYDISSGKQAHLSFSDEFRHCNVIIFDGRDWIASDFTAEGIVNRVAKVSTGARFIEALKKIPSLQAMVVTYIDKRHKTSWRPWWVRSCNEVCRYISSIKIGFTFNPRHLYNKLLKCRKGNYEVISHWRRSEDGII